MSTTEHHLHQTRRHFLTSMSRGLGAAALASLFDPSTYGSVPSLPSSAALPALHHAARARRVIYLYMAGGPSQFETFDNKPLLRERHGRPIPSSLTDGIKLAFLQDDKALKCMGSKFGFQRCGKSGQEISELLPHLQKVADELCIVRSLETEQVNHDPAHTFMNTGTSIAGRPSIGSWISYGLGNASENLPCFVVMRSGEDDQPISTVNWHSGFLPSAHQGVQFYSTGTPLHYIQSPAGIRAETQRSTIDAIAGMNRLHHKAEPDPEILARMAQYELAFRMQSAVPELADFSGEPESVRRAYGVEKPDGSFAANCLMARRMVERGVRFIQLYHTGWDHHGNIERAIPKFCKQIDQAGAALITDLKSRGLLEDTLVIWGGEFGRTPMAQGDGRDHHTRSGAMFLAGGGVRGGMTYGETDDFGCTVAQQPFHVHDFHATLLHLLGVDHLRLTYKFQGRNFRLTDVFGKVVKSILA